MVIVMVRLLVNPVPPAVAAAVNTIEWRTPSLPTDFRSGLVNYLYNEGHGYG